MPPEDEPLAHSAAEGKKSQTYADHITQVRGLGSRHAAEMLAAAGRPWPAFQHAVDDADAFHDLGKLDDHIQSQLRKGPGASLKCDHVDAGVAHAIASGAVSAAWIIRSHHAPGLPDKAVHFSGSDNQGRLLRGRRDDSIHRREHEEQKAHTDQHLARYITLHERWCGPRRVVRGDELRGLALRLALSCVVDADHTDTARAVGGVVPFEPDVQPRWAERRDHLKAYIKRKQSAEASDRNATRGKFFDDCFDSSIMAPIASCEGPVGIGKTTAVMAYLLKRAEERNLRRIFVVAPYTNILTQTATTLRDALCLEGEDPEAVVLEHHHRAEFEHDGLRGAAVTWRALIIVTTAVQFFETVSANAPAMLRKLHRVPGSAIFIDEAHAALPVQLWRQYWLWLNELAKDWNCPTVLASGSLGRFWTDPEIVSAACVLPELVTIENGPAIFNAERRRVRYDTCTQAFTSVDDFCAFTLSQPGPRVIVMNTLQNAALVARYLGAIGHHVHHISTALCPPDRARILAHVVRDLEEHRRGDWTLVGTSCIEAGLNLSFRTGFRERFGTCNLLQLGGRVSREDEYRGQAVVFDFALQAGAGVTSHPAAAASQKILLHLFKSGEFDRLIESPAELVTRALNLEINLGGGLGSDALFEAERDENYPVTAAKGRVIATETKIVVVKKVLQQALAARQKIGFRALLDGSVQIWPYKVRSLDLEPVRGWGDDLFLFPPQQYDSERLGIMQWLLSHADLEAKGGVIL